MEEDLDEWIPRSRRQSILNISHTEEKSDEHAESEDAIDKHTKHHSAWKNNSRIMNLFRHLQIISSGLAKMHHDDDLHERPNHHPRMKRRSQRVRQTRRDPESATPHR